MTCLFCDYASPRGMNRDGTPMPAGSIQWYRHMNIYCNHPERGRDGQCLPISWRKCSEFIPAPSDKVEAREKFYARFPEYESYRSILAQR